ncbi:MAG: hypothetical protein WCP89_02025 [archaeon]
MIINDELDFRQWFKDNHRKLGFSKIVKENFKGFPDFIVLKDGEEKRVELETLASNFIYHKHPVSETDFVVCVKKDVELKVPVIEIKNLKLVSFLKKESEFSILNKIKRFIDSSNERVFTTPEIARGVKINPSTAEKYLLELVIEGKIEKIKKLGVNLWMLK